MVPLLALSPRGVSASELNRRRGGSCAPQIWREPNGDISAVCGRNGKSRWVLLPGIARFSFDSKSPRLTATPIRGLDHRILLESYHRYAIPLILQARGVEVLHASAILTRAGVIGFLGNAKAGKSTLAYALGSRGYPVWSDDALAIRITDRQVLCRSLPFRLRLRPDAARAMRRRRQPRSVKPELDAPLRALCFLSRGKNGPARISLLAYSRRVSILLRQAFCFSLREPGLKRRMMERYTELGARVPVFEIRYSTGWDRLARVIRGIEGLAYTLEPRSGHRV